MKIGLIISKGCNKMSPLSKKEVQERLKIAVDWKIFEWQALLIGADGDSISDKELCKCKDWLQPIHYKEVVNERAHEGRCGFPCCHEQIKPPVMEMDEPDAQDWSFNQGSPKIVKIDRVQKKVLELGVEDRAKLYYCTKAGEKVYGAFESFYREHGLHNTGFQTLRLRA